MFELIQRRGEQRAREKAAAARHKEITVAIDRPKATKKNLKLFFRRRLDGKIYEIPFDYFWDSKWWFRHSEIKKAMKAVRWDILEHVSQQFPQEPRTQSEAVRNEDIFWRYWADAFSPADHTGRKELTTHLNLSDFYRCEERWVLIHYFAATGKVIDPFLRYFAEHVDTSKKTNAWHLYGSRVIFVHPWDRKFLEELDSHQPHIASAREAHFQKWGEWFVSHVEQAFQRITSAQAPRPNHYGEGGFASLGDVQAAQGRSDVPYYGPQTQTFED